LKEIELPESLNTIDGDAFCGCSSLLNITIPKNVKTIGKNAFANTGLTRVVFEGTEPPTFGAGSTQYNFTAVVPKGTIDAYRAQSALANCKFEEYAVNDEVVDAFARAEIESLKLLLKPFMSEVWEIVDAPEVMSVYGSWNVKFTSNGEHFNNITVGYEDYSDPNLAYDGMQVYGIASWDVTEKGKAYQTIVIKAGQELPTGFVEWLNNNATLKGYQLEINSGSGSGEDVSGNWIFNENLKAPNELNYEPITYSLSFTHDGTNYRSITFYDTHDVTFDGSMVYNSGEWHTIDAPNPVIDIAEGQIFSTEFITWLKANATRA
jgi:hypothetical protein